ADGLRHRHAVRAGRGPRDRRPAGRPTGAAAALPLRGAVHQPRPTRRTRPIRQPRRLAAGPGAARKGRHRGQGSHPVRGLGGTAAPTARRAVHEGVSAGGRAGGLSAHHGTRVSFSGFTTSKIAAAFPSRTATVSTRGATCGEPARSSPSSPLTSTGRELVNSSSPYFWASPTANLATLSAPAIGRRAVRALPSLSP